MTESHGCSDLFFYSLWLTWSPIVWPEPTSSRPEGLCAKLGSEDITKRENPSSPKPSSITEKRFSASIETVNGSYSSHLENINCCFFQSLCWQNHQSRGQHDPSIVGFQKKGRLCVCEHACVFIPLILAGVVCRYCWSAEHMCSWQVCEIPASALVLSLQPLQLMWTQIHCLCVCGVHLWKCWMKSYFMLAAEWQEPQCDRQAPGDLKLSNGPSWNFLLIPWA